MPIEGRNDVNKIEISPELDALLARATKVHTQRFGKTAWLGRCIFLSWYCSIGSCTFCFRSTQKHKIKFPHIGRRTRESIFAEALIAKKAGWRLEFLTGGHDMYPDTELLDIARTVKDIFGEKIWLNIGALKKEELEKFAPLLEGIVASIETPNPFLHKKVCPDKPMEPYLEMLNYAKELGIKRSITLVLGIGETISDYGLLIQMINNYALDRITVYSLRPVKGTEFEHGPNPEYVAEWIAKLRINFPDLEIIAGSSETRIPELSLLLRAGANALTKLPATKIFATTGADMIHEQFKIAGRDFTGNLIELPSNLDWESEISQLNISAEMRKKVLERLHIYEKDRLARAYKGFQLLDK